MKKLLLICMLAVGVAHAQENVVLDSTGMDAYYVMKAKHCAPNIADEVAQKKADKNAIKSCRGKAKRLTDYEMSHTVSDKNLCHVDATATYKCL